MIPVASFALGLVMALPMIGVLILRGLALLRSQQLPIGPQTWDGETASSHLQAFGIGDVVVRYPLIKKEEEDDGFGS